MVARLLALSLVLATAACGGSETPDSRAQVLAAAYPFAWAAEQVAGPDAKVTNLVEGGGEPHDIELTPRQVQATRNAALVVYLQGFQPAVDDAVLDVEESARLDLTAASDVVAADSGLGGATEAGDDPHVWLDPRRMSAIVVEVARRLGQADPDNAGEYQARAERTATKLAELDTSFTTKLRSCERRELVTAHTAFGYLADRYRLEQVGVTGLDPEAEPNPGRIADVARYARAKGVTTIYFESLVDPKLARTVAAEVGATTAVLDPVEGVKEGDDYFTVMRRNLDALTNGLGCR